MMYQTNFIVSVYTINHLPAQRGSLSHLQYFVAIADHVSATCVVLTPLLVSLVTSSHTLSLHTNVQNSRQKHSYNLNTLAPRVSTACKCTACWLSRACPSLLCPDSANVAALACAGPTGAQRLFLPCLGLHFIGRFNGARAQRTRTAGAQHKC